MDELFFILIAKYVNVIDAILKKIRIRLKPGKFVLEFKQVSESLDERIEKIVKARDALTNAIEAVDELATQAEKNKKDAEKALEDLVVLEKDKKDLEAETKASRQLIDSDIAKFKQMVGIPSASEQRHDKLVGFFSGVLASIIASIIISVAVLAFNYLAKDNMTPVGEIDPNANTSIQENP